MTSFEKLAPFMLRAKTVEVGRDRLNQIKKRLACLLITTDISENSKKEMLETFSCPVYQHFTSQEIEQMFGFRGTKVLGFHRSPLTVSALPLLQPYQVYRENKEGHKNDANK